jgi:chloride channel 7
VTVPDDKELLSSIRRRVQVSSEKIETGSLNVLSAKYESLDYDTCENYLLLDEERKKGYRFIVRKSIARWYIFLLIGMITAFIACAIDISIEELSQLKYASLSHCILCSFHAKLKNNSAY